MNNDDTCIKNLNAYSFVETSPIFMDINGMTPLEALMHLLNKSAFIGRHPYSLPANAAHGKKYRRLELDHGKLRDKAVEVQKVKGSNVFLFALGRVVT